ncbi:MAG: ABC transporter permease subunit [Deltaproteobacteria bacterium]|nr:ABC transporter permease subunit [Deltaproteobacteria bacterium]
MKALTIAKRELRSYFNSPVAYIIVCLFLLILGVFFWQTFFLAGRATCRDLFRWVARLLVVAGPAISMRLVAEEKRTGTFEVLVTMPVRDRDVILGKYAAAVGLLVVMLVMTFGYPISVAQLGKLDWGPVYAGYLGLLLLGASYIAIGIWASSITDNQLIALVLSLVIGGFLYFVDWFLPLIQGFFPDWLQWMVDVIEWVSLDYHFQSIMRGVIDTRDLVYFTSIILVFLMLAFRSIESRKWK